MTAEEWAKLMKTRAELERSRPDRPKVRLVNIQEPEEEDTYPQVPIKGLPEQEE